MSRGRNLLFGRSGDREFKNRTRQFCLNAQIDLFSSLLYGSRHAAKKIVVRDGRWPDEPGFLVLGFHCAVGSIALDDLKAHGFQPHFLHEPVHRGTQPASWIANWRLQQLSRLSGGEPLTTGGSYTKIRRLISKGQVVVALADSPPEKGKQCCRASLFNKRILLRSGLLSLAVKEQLPVVFFYITIQSNNRYKLTTTRARVYPATGELADGVTHVLESLLETDNAAWDYLNGVEAFSATESQVKENEANDYNSQIRGERK